MARLKQLGGGGEANWLNEATPTPPPRHSKIQTDQRVKDQFKMPPEDVKKAVDLIGKQ